MRGCSKSLIDAPTLMKKKPFVGSHAGKRVKSFVDILLIDRFVGIVLLKLEQGHRSENKQTFAFEPHELVTVSQFPSFH